MNKAASLRKRLTTVAPAAWARRRKGRLAYTHVGLEDQAEALKLFPAPVSMEDEATPKPASPAANGSGEVQRYSSTSEHTESPSVASDGNGTESVDHDETIKNPCQGRGYDAESHSESSDGITTHQWRRRESNPRLISTQRAICLVVA